VCVCVCVCARVGLSVGCVGVGMCACAPACMIVYEVCHKSRKSKKFHMQNSVDV